MSTVLPRAGGKSRMLLAPTLQRLDLDGISRVVEPFAGGAPVSLAVLVETDLEVWLNDLDASVATLSQTLFLGDLDSLIEEFLAIEPTDEMRSWYLRDDLSTAEFLAYAKVVRDGNVKKAGLRTDFRERLNLEARERVAKAMRRYRVLGEGRVEVTCLDGVDLIASCGAGDLIYADPPYLGVGDDLYALPLDRSGHARLSSALLSTEARWVCSAGDSDEIRALFPGCAIETIGKSGNGTEEILILGEERTNRTDVHAIVGGVDRFPFVSSDQAKTLAALLLRVAQREAITLPVAESDDDRQQDAA